MILNSLLRLGFAPLVLATSALTAATITTEPLGYVRTHLETGYKAVGFPLVNPALAEATVVANDAHSLTASSTQSLGALLEAGRPYYVEITDGALEGERFDIDTAATRQNNSAVIALAANSTNTTLATLPANALAGMHIVIRAHITLGQIGGFVGDAATGANGTQADAVLTLDSQGRTAEGWFADTAGTWRSLNSSDDSDCADQIVAPGTGVLYVRRVAATDLLQIGAVRTNAFRQNLSAGYELLASPFPASASPAQLAAYPANPWTASAQPADADQISMFSAEGGLARNYYLNTDGKWAAASGSADAQVVIAATDAVAVYRHAADNAYQRLSPLALN